MCVGSLDHLDNCKSLESLIYLKASDIIVPFCRLSLTRDSFVPATVREWNNLNLSVRNLDTLSKFKKAIRSVVLWIVGGIRSSKEESITCAKLIAETCITSVRLLHS
jgi:hypothetical protein